MRNFKAISPFHVEAMRILVKLITTLLYKQNSNVIS